MKYAVSGLGLAATALATSRTSAPSGCSTVASSGGDYTTVQDAVDAASEGDCIFLAKGTYSEQVLVETASLTIYGYTSDTSSYSGNGATITDGLSQDDGLSDDETGTLRVHAADFKLYNVDVVNSRGEGSQAIALSAYDDSGYYGCSFQGYQDTVLTESGNQLYANCEIVGATDFIFGQESMAWFENCDLRVLEASLGYLTGKRLHTIALKQGFMDKMLTHNLQQPTVLPPLARASTSSTTATSPPTLALPSPPAPTTSAAPGVRTPTSSSKRLLSATSSTRPAGPSGPLPSPTRTVLPLLCTTTRVMVPRTTTLRRLLLRSARLLRFRIFWVAATLLLDTMILLTCKRAT